ncbi:MAG: M28 family peptidase, partial [Kiritimatiellaceae bacterium]|nr:M28 family peptidase [Kiritimatiellaceae bacterium]
MKSRVNETSRLFQTERPLWLRLSWVSGSLLLFILSVGCCVTQPAARRSPAVNRQVNPERMKAAVTLLSVDYSPRSYQNPDNLNRTADYIFNQFKQAGGEPAYQVFKNGRGEYKNVRCVFGKGKGRRIVVGAHYDSCAQTPGADDNASGVAGLIELAHLLGKDDACGEVELVAYSLEEPPFFGTDEMGSYIHAQSLVRDQVDIQGVIVLEMIGYFSDEPGSQDSPMLLLKLFYPNRGNYILVAGRDDQKSFTKQIKIGMKGATDLPVYSISAPRSLPGIDFSDHRNYWRWNMDAVMVTDTAFYRNKAYHTANDTADRLDYSRMGKTVLGVYSALIHLRTPIMKTITCTKFS